MDRYMHITMADTTSRKIATDVARTGEQLKEQYEIEKELANRLRNSSKDERQNLYAQLYDEIVQACATPPTAKEKGCADHAARGCDEQRQIT